MKRLLLLSLAVISIIAISLGAFGCAGLTDQQIVSKIIDTSNNVKSFKLGMDLSENMGNMSVKETGTASVNSVTHEMLMNTTLVIDSSPGGTQTDTMDEYLTGGYLYIKDNTTGTDYWTKIKVDESRYGGSVKVGTIAIAIRYRIAEPESGCVQVNYTEDVD
jgi:hypothetical protein